MMRRKTGSVAPVELHLIDVGNEKTSTFSKGAASSEAGALADDDDAADFRKMTKKETAFYH